MAIWSGSLPSHICTRIHCQFFSVCQLSCRVQRGGGGRCRVQQGDSPRKEAVPEPASPGTVGVGAVLGDAARPPQTSSVLDSLDGGE